VLFNGIDNKDKKSSPSPGFVPLEPALPHPIKIGGWASQADSVTRSLLLERAFPFFLFFVSIGKSVCFL
jgi:hypothetical protein